MAEITSPDFPGERLVVSENSLLAEKRTGKREELLAVTERELARIQAGGAAGAPSAAQRRGDRPSGRRGAGPAPHGQAFPDQHR
jgi:hypothetical protein